MPRTIRLPEFENEPGLDFSNTEIQKNLDAALGKVRRSISGRYFPMLISGREVSHDGKYIERENPSDIKEILGYTCAARKEDVDEAISIMKDSREVREWMMASHEERAWYLKRAASTLRDRRYLFLALLMLEAGKTRWEADGEFCEAIDFLEYYADYAPFLARLNQATIISPLRQKNSGVYSPVGIGVSIQPWNFPLAISIGPTAAGLVMGNPMIYKPAEETSITGYYLSKAFYDTGIPNDVFHFMPGDGDEIGDYLVNHPAVRLIAFTGSKDVRRIIQNNVHNFNREVLPTLPPCDRHEKVIASAESGGKGAMIVDEDFDVQEAAQYVIDSAFSFQGQKCSAGTRVIVVGAGLLSTPYVQMGRLLYNAIMNIRIGSPEDPNNKMGPMISKEALKKVNEYKNLAHKTGRAIGGYLSEDMLGKGYFSTPMLVENIAPESRIFQEEIFGPVLALIEARDFDEALHLANNSEFGLTGGVFTNNDEHWQRAAHEFEVGNLYRNRKISGSMVGQNPFGGYKMSGNSTKAGGWDYLLNFVNRKSICVKL